MDNNTTLINKIVSSLNTNPAAVVRALEVLYANQTADEQVSGTTKHSNGVGFSGCDANTGTWLVTTVIAEGRTKGRPEGQLLRGKALQMGRRIALKYAGTQLLELARAKGAVKGTVSGFSYTPAPPKSFGFAVTPVGPDDEWAARKCEEYEEECEEAYMFDEATRARMNYYETMNELSFVAGGYDNEQY